MDKKAVGLSIVSLTAAATLFGVSPVRAEGEADVIVVEPPGECLQCEPTNPFWKLRTVSSDIQSGVFHKIEGTVFSKYKIEEPFHKFDDAFFKFDNAFQALFHKD